MESVPVELVLMISGHLSWIERIRLLGHVSGRIRRKLISSSSLPLPLPLPPLVASMMTLRPPDESPWRFLLFGVLGLDCLRGKRFVAPEEEPDPRWSGFMHLVEAEIADHAKTITVTESFNRGVRQLSLRFAFNAQQSSSSLSPPRSPCRMAAGPLSIASDHSFVLDLRPNGRLWMLGRTTISSALPSSWSSCLVLEGALELESPPYISQVVQFDSQLPRILLAINRPQLPRALADPPL